MRARAVRPRRLGHDTRHFNVGQYRRKQKGESDVQDAAFFDHNNPVRARVVAGLRRVYFPMPQGRP